MREGGRKKHRQTNSSQVGSSLVNSESVILISYGVLLLATSKELILIQLKHICMLHFYSPLSLPLRTWLPFMYSVWLGTIKIDYSNKGVKHHVFKTVFHPQSQNINADIALLKLVSGVTFTTSILPICLPNITNQLTIPGSCWVTGWGQATENEGEHG